MTDRVDALVAALGLPARSSRHPAMDPPQWLAEADDDELELLLERLCGLAGASEPPSSGGAAAWEATLDQLSRRWNGTQFGESSPHAMSAAVRDRLATLYRALGPTSAARHYLLLALAHVRGWDELPLLAQLLADDPPDDPLHAAQVLWPLFVSRTWPPEALFPKLLEGLRHGSTAAAVLDLANFLTREGRVARHPATEQASRLAALLGEVVGRLGELEQRPLAAGDDANRLRAVVSDGVGLAAALCDALGLVGDRSVVGKLYQAAELGHRRLRAEAAAALARLGEEGGREALVALAAEPLARLRVLAYADELDLADRVADEFRTPQARAEAEVVCWLAAPHQVGLPPQECELIDHRTLYWPGYHEPQECFLFRYVYFWPNGAQAGFALAGPATHAFGSDLSSLPLDDVYAAFAGWSAEHEDIYEVELDRLSTSGKIEAARLERRLRDAGYTAPEPLLLGFFLGERALLARAARDGRPGVVVVDQAEEHWFPDAPSSRALTPSGVYLVWKGRKLLRAFNG